MQLTNPTHELDLRQETQQLYDQAHRLNGALLRLNEAGHNIVTSGEYVILSNAGAGISSAIDMLNLLHDLGQD